ncbi:hypothetical protein FRAHR75_680015 [Frankia sp. Hr75.2]|nr:hypothetical protein FRAHR75_680015 [Frankia sp. Hr75.2]
MVLGGNTPVALTDAVELGTGWCDFGHTPADMAQTRALMIRHADAIGKDRTGFRITVTPRVRLTAELAKEYEAASVDQLVVSVETDAVNGVRRRLESNVPSRLGIC